MPESPVRGQIDQIIFAAEGMPPEDIDQFCFNALGKVLGLSVLRAGNHIKDPEVNTCAHYALGERMGMPWIVAGEPLPIQFKYFTAEFLLAMGFTALDDPEPGAVALYYGDILIPPRLASLGVDPAIHVGYMESTDMVMSKIGSGPVVSGPLEAVPSGYGDTVLFYRPPLTAVST